MGCQCCKNGPPEKPIPDMRFTPIGGGHNESFTPDLEPPPVPPRPIVPPTPPIDPSRVILYIPIYVATRSHRNLTTTDEIPFEENDEFKLITDHNETHLCLQHLRTGGVGLVAKSFVRADPKSPLRLATNDRGIIDQCLSKESQPGAYAIRGSRHDAMQYALSINQRNIDRNSEHWHYLISHNPETNRFYFRDEKTLRNLEFSTFHSLVNHKTVRQCIPMTEPLPHSIVFEDELWNIPLKQLEIGEKIGQGEFGEVFRGIWKHGAVSTPVAIKKIRTGGITTLVKREIEAMKTLINLYIVSLQGVTKDPLTNDIYLVTEYMENGDLKTWLTNLPYFPPDQKIYQFAQEISKGMAYLEERNYVHRDLACRNILVGPQAMTVKIADFGLSTIVHDGDPKKQQENAADRLAFRWLAPELFEDRTAFSTKSDVWSYGILLIEIWQKGAAPYDGNMRPYVSSLVESGEIHPKPSECPQEFYDSIIRECLRFNAKDRLTFRKLVQILQKWRSS